MTLCAGLDQLGLEGQILKNLRQLTCVFSLIKLSASPAQTENNTLNTQKQVCKLYYRHPFCIKIFTCYFFKDV